MEEPPGRRVEEQENRGHRGDEFAFSVELYGYISGVCSFVGALVYSFVEVSSP